MIISDTRVPTCIVTIVWPLTCVILYCCRDGGYDDSVADSGVIEVTS
jgi:hypothetical protein